MPLRVARRLPQGWMTNRPAPARATDALLAAPGAWRRLCARQARLAAALLAALALLLFVHVFDWTWCRPLIRHYVLAHSGRAIEFDELRVRVDRSLNPSLDLRGLRIQNAPWATARVPLIRAGRLSATFALRSLWSDKTIVTRIELEDAQVDLERQADGLRNWRLAHPDDRGPARVRVLALAATRSSLHVDHRGIGLEADAWTQPLPRVQSLPGHPELALTQRVVFHGRLPGGSFDGDAAVGDVLPLVAASEPVAVSGSGRWGSLRIAGSGLTNDLLAPGEFDLALQLSAAASAGGATWPLPEALARMRPLAARAQVSRHAGAWSVTALQARAGRGTTLAGELRLVDAGDGGGRGHFQASLHEVVVDLDDLWARTDGASAGDPSSSALPPTALATARLREFDGEADLGRVRFTGGAPFGLQGLHAKVSLRDGVLQLRDLDLGIGDGHVTGTLRLDAARAPSALTLDLTAHGLQLARLWPALARGDSVDGAIDGRATLRASGESTRAWASSADGLVSVSLAAPASVSRRLDARLSLDGSAWLRSLFDSAGRVPVLCASLVMQVDHGQASSRSLAFETERTALAGHARVNLVDESFDLSLVPRRKTRSVLALERTIHASGPWRAPHVALEPARAEAPVRCAPAAAQLAAR